MRAGRLFRHMLWPDWWVLRAFPVSALRTIEQAIAESERTHQGELRFVVEAGLPLPGLLRSVATGSGDRIVRSARGLGHRAQ